MEALPLPLPHQSVVFVGIFMTGICLGIHRGIGQNNVFDDSEKREQRVQEWVENDIEVALSMADWTGKEEERFSHPPSYINFILYLLYW